MGGIRARLSAAVKDRTLGYAGADRGAGPIIPSWSSQHSNQEFAQD